MPVSIAAPVNQSARARALQKRYPFYTPQNCQTLAEIEAQEARKPIPASDARRA